MEDSARVRLRLIAVMSVSLFFALFGRLWYLQALQTEEFQQVATSNITRTIRTQAPRGRVFDVNGNVLVDNRLSTIVTVNRENLFLELSQERGMDSGEREAFRTEMFTQLARELSQSGQLTKVRDLERAYNDPSYTDFESIPVAHDVDEELLIFIGERPDIFPGVEVDEELVREYPYGDAAAHILGYVGSITGAELEAKETTWSEGDPNGKPYRSNDEIGKVGIERFFEDDLRGVPGTRVIEVDNRDNYVREVREPDEPRRGSDIFLTIDIDLQIALERDLASALEGARETEAEPGEPPFRAPAGAGVVMDPRDGSVLAMASYPTFDPRDFISGLSFAQKEDLDDPLAHQPLLNRAIAEIYPAASTFKPFVGIAAERFDIFGWDFVEEWNVPTSDPGFWRLKSCLIGGDNREELQAGGCIKTNAGDATMEGVDLQHSLTFSSDTYYYKLGEAFWLAPDSQFPPDGIQQVASEFGLGATTGIQISGEKAGIMPTPQLMAARNESNPEAFPRGQWNSGDSVLMAIGQGEVAVTPLQLTNAYAALANGGDLFAPNIVTLVQPPPGDPMEPVEFAPRVVRSIDIPDTIDDVILDGLLGVTLLPKLTLDRPSGTAYDAFNEPAEGGVDFDLINWPVAGKTGTAQTGNGTKFADNSMFVGWGPSGSASWGTAVEEPEFVMAVILEEAGFGSKVAAPMVAQYFDRIAQNEVPEALTQDEVDAFYGVDAITDIAVAAVEGEIEEEPLG